jgi:tRNA(Ile)-lysidine synthase
MDLLARVRRFIREHDLAPPGARVVAAVSGGGDSMALAHVLAELDRAGDLRLAGLAHFNHQLRATADRDEAFVREAARTLDVPIVADRADVAERAARERRSIEDAGRTARYAFFERARVELAADVVALGHTRDDQAETFLLRLLRGAGPRGLAGMHPRHGTIVRPLLDCRRDELRGWLDARGVAHVEDESNADVRVPRNRVRAELVPLLADRFNPAVVDVLADEAALAREMWQWMDEASAPFLATGELDVAELNRLPPALRRLVVWRALTTHAGGRHISFDHVRDVIRLMQASDGSLDLPGQQVQRIGGRIVILTGQGSRGAHEARSSAANLYSYPLSIPGEVAVPESGCVVSVAPATGDVLAERRATVGNGPIAVVRGDRLTESLVVRNRRPGDRFQPVGLRGRKKLQDLFVDQKVARADRDAVPLVVDARDRIVWVAGFGIDEAFRVTDAAQAVLLLRLTRA